MAKSVIMTIQNLIWRARLDNRDIKVIGLSPKSAAQLRLEMFNERDSIRFGPGAKQWKSPDDVPLSGSQIFGVSVYETEQIRREYLT